jgi:uncharacterized caspase-like protein
MSNLFSHGYALLIGVGESAYPKWSLPVTVKDMQALKSVLVDPNFCAYPDDKQHIRLLHDAEATRDNILEGLDWLKTQTAKDSQATVVVYYSGHGLLDKSTNSYYLLQHDIEPFDLPNSALDAKTFTNALRQIAAQRLLVVIDSCHAEGMATAKDGTANFKMPAGFVSTSLSKGLVTDLKQGEGRVVFTSSRGEQKSWVRPDEQMSIYTDHFIEALKGAGSQTGDTVVRISNLMNYVGKTVPVSSVKTLHQKEQTPFFDAATEDFAVAMLCGGKGISKDGWNNPPQTETASTSSTNIQQTARDNAIQFGHVGGNVVNK